MQARLVTKKSAATSRARPSGLPISSVLLSPLISLLFFFSFRTDCLLSSFPPSFIPSTMCSHFFKYCEWCIFSPSISVDFPFLILSLLPPTPCRRERSRSPKRDQQATGNPRDAARLTPEAISAPSSTESLTRTVGKYVAELFLSSAYSLTSPLLVFPPQSKSRKSQAFVYFRCFLALLPSR